jgi:hypothetical protein
MNSVYDCVLILSDCAKLAFEVFLTLRLINPNPVREITYFLSGIATPARKRQKSSVCLAEERNTNVLDEGYLSLTW